MSNQLTIQFQYILQQIKSTNGTNLELIFDYLFTLHQFIKENCNNTEPVLEFFQDDTDFYIDSLFQTFNHLLQSPSFIYQLENGEFDSFYITSIFLQLLGTVCTFVDAEVAINGDTFSSFIHTAIQLFELNIPRIHHDDYDYDDEDDDEDDDENRDIDSQLIVKPKNKLMKRPKLHVFSLPKLGEQSDEENTTLTTIASQNNNQGSDDEEEEIDIHKEITNNIIAIIHCVVSGRELLFTDQLLRFCYFCSATKYYNTTTETQFYIPYWFLQVQKDYFTLLLQQFQFQSFPQLLLQHFDELCPGEDYTTLDENNKEDDISIGRFQFLHHTRIQPQYINTFSLISYLRMCTDLIIFMGENALLIDGLNNKLSSPFVVNAVTTAETTTHAKTPLPLNRSLHRVAFFINKYYSNDDHTIIDMSLNILILILDFIDNKLFHLPVSYIQTISLFQSISKSHHIFSSLRTILLTSPLYSSSSTSSKTKPYTQQSPYHTKLVTIFGGISRLINTPSPLTTSSAETSQSLSQISKPTTFDLEQID